MWNPRNTAVCIPYYGGYDPEHFSCVLGLVSMSRDNCPWEGLKIYPIHTCPYIDLARSLLAAKALAENPSLEVLVFIDHDIIFEPGDVERLINGLLESEYDVTGAGYSMRGPGAKMIGSILPSAVPADGKIPFFDAPGAGLFPALYTGFGFTAIRRRVFERLNETCPEMQCGWTLPVRPYFALDLSDLRYRGEDVSFCGRVTRAGMKIAVDTRIRICHKGAYKYKLEDMGIVVPSIGALTITPSDTGEKRLAMSGLESAATE